jgi:hypothetical protein
MDGAACLALHLSCSTCFLPRFRAALKINPDGHRGTIDMDLNSHQANHYKGLLLLVVVLTLHVRWDLKNYSPSLSLSEGEVSPPMMISLASSSAESLLTAVQC